MIHKGYNNRLESLTGGRAVGTCNRTCLHRQVVQYGSVCPEVHASSKEITRRKQRCSDVAHQFNSVGQSPRSLVLFTFPEVLESGMQATHFRSFARPLLTWDKI